MKETIVSTIFIISLYMVSVSSSVCYWNSGCPYKYFSSKTPYNSIRGDIRDSLIKLKACEPVSVWSLIRHGKRYPDPNFEKIVNEALVTRDSIISSYSGGQSTLCAQDIQNLKKWEIDTKMFQDPNGLTKEGYDDMVGIGNRIKETFPKLLDNLQEGSYLFRPAYGSRMEKSARGFIEGLENKELLLERSQTGYDISAPYVTCGKFQRDVINNSNIYYDEFLKYFANTDFLAIKDRIYRRLGLNGTLSDKNIRSIYELCQYTFSGIDNNLSPWCALFTTEDLKILEYLGDLKHYYRNGYGTKINEIFGRIPLSDMLTTFQQVKSGNGKKITAYFTHATMLNMVFTTLNLFKDKSPLTGAFRDPKREWRSSYLSVFSVNFIAVLNRCNVNEEDDYNVVFYLNEEPLPVCSERVCSWQEFEDKFKPFLNTSLDFCEFEVEPN